MMQFKLTSRGFNLIEAAITLAVVGLIIGGIWVSAAALRGSFNLKETVAGVQVIINNLQNRISISEARAMGTIQNISSLAIAMKAPPEDWIDGTAIRNPYGGNVIPRSAVTPERIDLMLTSIPRSACVEIVSRISAMGSAAGSTGAGGVERSGLGAITVVESPTRDNCNGTGSGTQTFPVTPAQALTLCNSPPTTPVCVLLTYGYSRPN